MSRLRTQALWAGTVGVAELVAKRPQRLNNGLAAAKNLLEHLLGMVVWCELQYLRQPTIQDWQIVLLLERVACLGQHPLADILQQGSGKRDGPGWIGSAAVECGCPTLVNVIGIEGTQYR